MKSNKKLLPSRALLLVLVVLMLSLSALPVRGSLGWSSPTLEDSSASTNILPSALQASNGTLWLAWQSNLHGGSTGRTDIVYKTYTNGVWSSDHNLTSSGWNSSPSLIQLSNGTILAFWSVKSGTSYLVYSGQTNGGSWSPPVQITSTTLNDTQPSAAVGRDGTIWLVWTRINSTCSSCFAGEQLFYKTWKAGNWLPEHELTNDTANQNYGSSVVVSKDGLVRVTWSKGAAGSIYQLYTKTYNGTTWSSDTQIVSSSSTDVRPSMIQDRNGTLWLFWGRLVVVSLLVQYYEVVGKYSYDLGATWSSETILTSTSTTIDSFMPSAVQSSTGVKPLFVFYASNQNVPSGYDIFAVMSTSVSPVHDVAVSSVSESNTLGTNWEYPGGLKSVGQSAIVTVTVGVTNTGDFLENPSITLSTTNTTVTTIGTLHSRIGPGSTMNFYFYWNTTNIVPARYGLSVSISGVGYTLGNVGDNSYGQTNKVHIIPLGDVDQDGSVTITDVSVFFYGYGFSSSCNCSRWNPYADIHNTGTIDIVDIGVAAKNYSTFT